MQQNPATGTITVGAATGGTLVSLAGTAGGRSLTGVAAGALGASSADAVNGSQLYGATQRLVSALGGGAAVDASGLLTGPTYGVQGSRFNSVGGAFSALDGQVTANPPRGPEWLHEMKHDGYRIMARNDGGDRLSGRTSPSATCAATARSHGNPQDGRPGLLEALAETRDIAVLGRRTGLEAALVSLGSVDSPSQHIEHVRPGHLADVEPHEVGRRLREAEHVPRSQHDVLAKSRPGRGSSVAAPR